jgi:hypothetical protein
MVNLIWNLLHFDQYLIGILGYQKLITLDSYGRLDLMRMHTLFLNTFSKHMHLHQQLYPFTYSISH